MSEPWPSPEARERYIMFLELLLRMQALAGQDEAELELVSRLDSLLKSHFPRTVEYVEKSLRGQTGEGETCSITRVAWAEARSVPGSGGSARVEGRWTTEEIDRDIALCLEEARGRIHWPSGGDN